MTLDGSETLDETSGEGIEPMSVDAVRTRHRTRRKQVSKHSNV